jgi:mono/diheme cytochrome c family protein
VRAYLKTIEAPPYPFEVDVVRAGRGKDLFETVCSQCHGTYGTDGEYPNLLLPVGEVGTDYVLAIGATGHAERFVDWFNGSFYGENARLDPQPGYVAPPLDGIWATAPFFHNGSVPTLDTLLDSSRRPRYWTRTYSDDGFDPVNVGWSFTEVDHGHRDETDPAMKKRIFDTTLLGYGNGGHTFGDVFSEEERADLIEYLKTL